MHKCYIKVVSFHMVFAFHPHPHTDYASIHITLRYIKSDLSKRHYFKRRYHDDIWSKCCQSWNEDWRELCWDPSASCVQTLPSGEPTTIGPRVWCLLTECRSHQALAWKVSLNDLLWLPVPLVKLHRRNCRAACGRPTAGPPSSKIILLAASEMTAACSRWKHNGK